MERETTVVRAVIIAEPVTATWSSRSAMPVSAKVGGAAHWSLWIDRAWNVPLAFEERRADGTVVRRAAFLKVNAAPVKVALPEPVVTVVAPPSVVVPAAVNAPLAVVVYVPLVVRLSL